MQISPEIKVTKLDAAQRQLRTALRVWFEDGDPVSIHTLLAAAHEIIHRLYRSKGLVNLVFDSDLIRDEYRGPFSKLIKQAPNFFTHALYDSNAMISFNPEVNDLLPLFLIQALRDMGESLGMEERAYTFWMSLNKPDLFRSNRSVFSAEAAEKLIGTEKKEFFDACQLLWDHGALREFLVQRPPE
jgi:hypothetical protein